MRAVAAFVLFVSFAGFASAQPYPAKPVRLVVPFPPGGPADSVARVLAQKLIDATGQQFVVDNRAGATGTIGAGIVAKSPPDGYTLLLGTSNELAMSPGLYDKLPYDPARDFLPVAHYVEIAFVLVVNAGLPVRSVADLVKLAKEKPGELSYASAGIGTFQHLGAELFRLEAKVNLLHVPFRGGGPALTDVLGGHNKIMFSSLVQAVPHIKSGRLRALGTGGKERIPALADVPTISEAGVPGYEALNWWGLLAPVGTPPAVIARLHKALSEAQDTPEIQSQFEKEGAATRKMEPEEFGKFIESEMKKWERVVKEGGIKAE